MFIGAIIRNGHMSDLNKSLWKFKIKTKILKHLKKKSFLFHQWGDLQIPVPQREKENSTESQLGDFGKLMFWA